jgi:Autotransporter beta-domain
MDRELGDMKGFNHACARALTAGVSILALLGIQGGSFAGEFFVDTETTVANGGQTIDSTDFDGPDSLTVTPAGAIRVEDLSAVADVIAIFGTGDGNSIQVDGTVMATGTLTAPDLDVVGVSLVGSGNTIDVRGNVTVNANHQAAQGATFGVRLDGSNNSVWVGGTVTATETTNFAQTYVSAINLSGPNSTATNDGTVIAEHITMGDATGFAAAQPVGINVLDDTSIGINNGRITATATAVSGSVGQGGDVALVYAYGINSRGAAINTGTIEVLGDATGQQISQVQAVGLANYFDGTFLENTGEIRVLGEANGPEGSTYAFSVGISADSDMRNSGKITVGARANGVAGDATSSLANAIEVGNPDPVGNGFAVYLDAPSYIGGVINTAVNNLAANRVTIATGASHSILWDLDGIDNSFLTVDDALVPAFYDAPILADATKIATFDPTLFASRPQSLADRSGVIGSLMRGRRAADGCDPLAIGGDKPERPLCGPQTTVWGGGFGRHMSYDGGYGQTLHVLNDAEDGFDTAQFGDDPTLDYDTSVYGGAGGVDWTNGSGLTIGAMAGYGAESMDASSPWAPSYDNHAQGFFAGAYGRAMAGPAAIDFDIAGGRLSHSDSRLVNDNLAMDDTGYYHGESWREASYDSWWLSLGGGLSADLAAGGWTVTPRVAGFYAMEWIDGYTETGGDPATNASVAAQNVGVFEGTIELAVSRQVMQAIRFTARGGYVARSATGDDTVEVTLLDMTRDVPTYADNPSALFAGGGFNVDLPGTASLQLGGRAFFDGHGMSGYEGTASLGVTF